MEKAKLGTKTWVAAYLDFMESQCSMTILFSIESKSLQVTRNPDRFLHQGLKIVWITLEDVTCTCYAMTECIIL